MATKQNRLILILACATFLFFGMATAGIGPVLPELAKNARLQFDRDRWCHFSLIPGSIDLEFYCRSIVRQDRTQESSHHQPHHPCV